MNDYIRRLIDKERIRREEVERFVKAVKPLMDELRTELNDIVAEYHKEFPHDGKVTKTTSLHSDLGLEIKRVPDGPTCQVYPDRVQRVLRVTNTASGPLAITIAYNDEGVLELVPEHVTISGLAGLIIAPILFPELIALGNSF